MSRDIALSRKSALAVAMAVSLLGGCLFEPRDSENPNTATGSRWVVPTVPQNVFTNMKNGLKDLTGDNYKRSIQDGFDFIPLAEDAGNPTLAGAFVDWTADVEKRVVDRLLADATDIVVNFTNIEQIFDQTPFAHYQLDYELRVVDTANDTTFYRAKAEFRMQDGSKGWQLFYWQDIERSPGFASWGFLRGSLRQL